MIKNVSVIVPAFNESVGISAVLEGLLKELKRLKKEVEIVVVNDASTDDTAEIVQKLAQKHLEIKLINNSVNKGYGGSLKIGLRHVKEEVVVIIDADGTYPLEFLEPLLLAMENADMVVGARKGPQVKVNYFRHPAKEFLRLLASFLTETNIPDLNSGFRVFKRELALKYIHLLPNKFSFTTTITMAFLSDGLEVKYIPINYHQRVGKSKIKPIDAWNFLILTIRTIFYFNPLRVVLPVASVLGVTGLIVLGYDIFVISDIGDSAVFLLLGALQILFFGLIADLIVRSSR